MKVAEIALDGRDSTGADIRAVYVRNPPHYAIYRTDQRVLVHFADDDEDNRRQRDKIAPLSPLRGEVRGLIDGWHGSKYLSFHSKAIRFDRRVSDALVMGIEGSIENAAALLATIKDDIIAERTSWARFYYMLIGAGTVLAVILLALILSSAIAAPTADPLLFATGTGALGAFFSIAIGLRSRTILTNLQMRDNASDAILRIVIGAIAAALLVCLFQTDTVSILQFGDGSLTLDADNYDWRVVTVVGFIAGFLERLVPDLLGKASFGNARTGAPPNSGLTPTSSPAPAVLPALPVPPRPAVPSPSESRLPTAGAPDGDIDGEADRADDEIDACLCDEPVDEERATADRDLPIAVGGVEEPDDGDRTGTAATS
ncbi:hypothetical protein HFP57_06360 [Parasphingopyxis algicola]|uniref:hypothetical protein n=1 Tax=Parasphingopyxis algicola TaxID=2026624 RepID=UPI0015A2916F|nr:hypothetical protein [Parasphingopyxis algicola]QLC24689.1 hypothetical protein HFP57_06360 [Parasphingopyxis algicola]